MKTNVGESKKKRKKNKHKWENGKKKPKQEKKNTRGEATVLSPRVLEYLLI
jgi:hypothetical protein